MRPRIVRVLGGSEWAPDLYYAVESIGHAAALCRAAVVTGGLASAMEAAANRTKAAGDLLTSGVLPGFSPQDANPYINLPNVPGLWEARRFSIVHPGEILIAMDGSPGTLSDITFALKSHLPVIGLDSRPVAGEIIRGRTSQETVDRALGRLDAVGPGGL